MAKVILRVYDVFRHKVGHAGMQPNYLPALKVLREHLGLDVVNAKAILDRCVGKGGDYLRVPDTATILAGVPIDFEDNDELEAFVTDLRRNCHVSVDVEPAHDLYLSSVLLEETQ